MEKKAVVEPLAPGQDIAVAVTMTTQLTDRRQIVMHTYLERDGDAKTYNMMLDKLGRVIDRQEAKYRLEALLITLATHQKTLKQLETDFALIDTRVKSEWERQGKKGDARLSNNELAQKGNAEQNIKRYRVEIAAINSDIEACKATIAKDD